jgi:hypothetical protein
LVPAVEVEAVVAVLPAPVADAVQAAVLPAALLPVVALVVLLLRFLQLPARLLREAQLLRPALPVVVAAAAVVLVQGLVASEILRSR